MKQFIKTHKKQLLQILSVLVVGVIISLVFFGVFWATGVITYDNGFSINAELFDALKGNLWLYIVFVIVMAIGCTVLCMNPVGSGVFVWLGLALFGANWKCFLATLSGCLLSYVMIDALGRFGGSKLIIKIFGEEEYRKVADIIRKKKLLYVLMVYLLTGFPDDFCCLVFGSMRVKWWLHILFAFVGKSIGIATVVFGVSIIPKEMFLPLAADKLYNWFVLIACLIVYIVFLFKVSNWINKKIDNYLERRQQNVDNLSDSKQS